MKVESKKSFEEKKNMLIHIIFLLFALMIELFVCNLRTFQSLLYCEKDISEYPVQLDCAQLLPNGDLVLDDDVAYVSIIVDNEKIKNIYIDVDVIGNNGNQNNENGICDLSLYIQDELISGGESKIRSVTERTIMHSVEASHFIFFESFGNAKIIQLELKPQNGNILRFNSIKLNSCRPILFSVIRVVFFLLLMELCYLFCPGSWAWKRYALASGKRGRAVLWIFYICVIMLAVFLMSGNTLMWNSSFNPYAELAEAITDGHLYVGEAPSEITELEGKLLSWGDHDGRIMFDHALYKGKYYIYFGILPMLTMYLPYYIATNHNLPDAAAVLLMTIIIIPGVYFILKEVIRRWFQETPFAILLLFTMAAISGMGVPALVSAPQVYTVAVMSGVLLTIYGTLFWLKAMPFWEHPVFLFVGSGCMALVAACRPNLLVYSLLIIPFCIYSYKEYTHEKVTKKHVATAVCVFIVPYILVAACVMYYNWVRFESPFQFGMIYNMTSIPSRDTAVDIFEMIPLAVYEYLFKTIEFNRGFPFIKWHYEGCVKEYSGTIYYYRTIGYGLFAQNPLLFVLFLTPFLRLKHKKAVSIMLVCTFITTMFFICMDTYMTQLITTRYSLEFSFLLYIMADITILLIWTGTEVKQNHIIIWLFVTVNMVSVLIGGLSFFGGPEFSIKEGNPELYYRIFYLFNIL